MSYILHEIDWLAHEVEQTRAEPLVRQILGRRLSQDDRANIRSWRVHVKDDFFVVSHSHAQQGGTVMVQVRASYKTTSCMQSERAIWSSVLSRSPSLTYRHTTQCVMLLVGAALVHQSTKVGRLQHRDFKKKTSPDMVPAGEFHAPRVFVVQGLADPLSQLTARPRETFLQKYPSIAEKHAEFKDALCLVRTALLPYNSGITYMTTLMPITLAQTEHYATPQDLAAAVDVAVKAYRDAFPATTATAATSGDSSSAPAAVALYRSLDPERDAAICRLVKSVANQELPAVYRSLHDKEKEEKQRNDVTRIVINQIMWQPLQDRNDPQFAMLLERATNTGRFSELNERQPFCLEGCKNSMGQEIVVQDDDPCPFHKRYGEANPTFAKCCKTSYLKRMQKAQQKGNAYAQHLMYEPVERVEVDKIEASHNPTTPFNIMPHIRIGYQDIGTVRLRVDPRITSIIKQRIDSCDLFHAVLPHKWLFWGYCPCKLGGMGIMSFGDVTLDPETGWLEVNAMTSGRLGALIKELKHFCTDFCHPRSIAGNGTFLQDARRSGGL